jgi:hypothetical protein
MRFSLYFDMTCQPWQEVYRSSTLLYWPKVNKELQPPHPGIVSWIQPIQTNYTLDNCHIQKWTH